MRGPRRGGAAGGAPLSAGHGRQAARQAIGTKEGAVAYLPTPWRSRGTCWRRPPAHACWTAAGSVCYRDRAGNGFVCDGPGDPLLSRGGDVPAVGDTAQSGLNMMLGGFLRRRRPGRPGRWGKRPGLGVPDYLRPGPGLVTDTGLFQEFVTLEPTTGRVIPYYLVAPTWRTRHACGRSAQAEPVSGTTGGQYQHLPDGTTPKGRRQRSGQRHQHPSMDPGDLSKPRPRGIAGAGRARHPALVQKLGGCLKTIRATRRLGGVAPSAAAGVPTAWGSLWTLLINRELGPG